MYTPFVQYRQLLWLTTAIFSIVVGVGFVSAEKITVPLTPSSFEQIEEFTKKNDGTLYENLEQAQCGGWDVSQSIGTTVGQGVANVTGLPGRTIQGDNPLNAKELGMALKNDNFYFPDEPTTCGFITACLPDDGSAPGSRRRPPFLRTSNNWQQCERPLDGYRTDDFPDPDGRVTYSCGGGKMDDVSSDTNFCPTVFAKNPSLLNPSAGTIRTPGDTTTLDENTAGGICQRLNEDWIYSLWRRPVINPVTGAITGYDYRRKGCTRFDDTNISTSPGASWDLDSYRYCCTDQPLDSAYKNCVACTGAECHQGIVATGINSDNFRINDPNPPLPYDTSHPENNGSERRYYSFFRHYLGNALRQKLQTGSNTNAPNNGATIEPTTVSNSQFDRNEIKNLPVACYGYWFWRTSPGVNDEEFWNPELLKIPTRLARCVLASYYEPNSPLSNKQFFWNDESKKTQMKATQAGKGSYFGINPVTRQPYADPPVNDAKRKDPPPDDNTTVWFKSLGRAFSLISHAIVSSEDFDLSDALAASDTALQRATVQRYVPNKNDLKTQVGATNVNDPKVLDAFKNTVLSRGALISAFDDTVTASNNRRPFTEWWQRIENAMNTYLTPPTVSLLLPAGWSIDLDPLHPIFTPTLPDTTSDEWRSNPELQSINVQLELQEDLLGEVTAYLEDSLIVHYTPKPVTVLVPNGSAKELRALASKWCTMIKTRDDTDDCSGASGEEKELMERLQEYADRIEDSRILRAQAAEIQAQFLELHTNIQKIIGDWVIKNTEDYVTWREQWRTREDIAPLWQKVQKQLWEFTGEVNQPWCMNNRYTLPVYTLLDSWFPYIVNSGGYSEKRLDDPQFPTFSTLHDLRPQAGITFDASRVTLGTGTFLIPVIEPLPVALDTIALGATGSPPLTLPPLPPLPDITTDIDQFIPEVLKGKTVPLTLGDKFTLDSIEDPTPVLNQIETMFKNMKKPYREFWGTLLIDPADVEDGTEEDCYAPNTGRCKHVEFDLHERLLRIASRPNVLLKEDFNQYVPFLNPVKDGPYSCLDSNFAYQKYWVCQHFAPHHIEPPRGFGITSAPLTRQQKTLDELRIKALEESWLDPGQEDETVPYILPYDQITPSFSVHEPVILYETGAITPTPPSPAP